MQTIIPSEEKDKLYFFFVILRGEPRKSWVNIQRRNEVLSECVLFNMAMVMSRTSLCQTHAEMAKLPLRMRLRGRAKSSFGLTF